MTNFEYYKDEIAEIVKAGTNVAVAKDKPVECSGLNCSECMLSQQTYHCSYVRTAWFLEEHVEKPKLTKKERLFCELTETGWIIRDIQGHLWCSKNEPTRMVDDEGCNGWIPFAGFPVGIHFPDCKFKFVKHDDEKLWSVEDLLKLEVLEE